MVYYEGILPGGPKIRNSKNFNVHQIQKDMFRKNWKEHDAMQVQVKEVMVSKRLKCPNFAGFSKLEWFPKF